MTASGHLGERFGSACAASGMDCGTAVFTARDVASVTSVSVVDMFEAAAFDEVTGTWGRRGWRTRAEREIAAAGAGGCPTVLIVDVDHFKSHNDRFGHLAGDMVLGKVVWAIRRGLRHVDLLGRFGGDELAILLADVHDPVQAQEIAERLRRQVERLIVRLPATMFSQAGPTGCSGVEISGVTVSIGAGVPGLGTRPRLGSLLAAADSAMYAAKASGRNAVRVACTTQTVVGGAAPGTGVPGSREGCW